MAISLLIGSISALYSYLFRVQGFYNLKLEPTSEINKDVLIYKFKGRGIQRRLFIEMIAIPMCLFPFFLAFLFFSWLFIKKIFLEGFSANDVIFCFVPILCIGMGFLTLKFFNEGSLRFSLYKSNSEKPDIEISDAEIKISTGLLEGISDPDLSLKEVAFLTIPIDQVVSFLVSPYRGRGQKAGVVPHYSILLKSGQNFYVNRRPLLGQEVEIIKTLRSKLKVVIELNDELK